MKELEQHYRVLLPALVGYARSLSGSQDVAEDLVATAFVRATEHVLVRGEVPGRPWFFVVIRRLAIDKARHSSTREVAEAGEVASDSPWQNPAHEAELSWSTTAVEACLSELPEESRLILKFREWDDESYRSIAKKMNLTVDQVKVGLFRARQRFREIYRRKYGVF